MGQNPRPVNILISSKIGSKMGGEFTFPKMGSQNGFDQPYGGWKKYCMTFVQIHSILLQLTPRPLINIGAQFGQVGLGHARFRSLATYEHFCPSQLNVK